MRLGIFGNKTTTLKLVESLAAYVDSLFLISLSDESLGSSDIAGAAHDFSALDRLNNVELIRVQDYRLRNEEALATLQGLRLDLGFTYGWQRLIPESVLSMVRLGVYGWHGSPFRFPNGRGRSPINWTIRLGRDRFFHYLFQLVPSADRGPVFDVQEIPVSPFDYIGELLDKAHENAERGAKLLIEASSSGDFQLTEQPEHAELWLPRLTPDDSILQPTRMTCEDALRIVRASSRPFGGSRVLASENSGTPRDLLVWRASKRPPQKGGGLGSLPPQPIPFLDGEIWLEDYEIL